MDRRSRLNMHSLLRVLLMVSLALADSDLQDLNFVDSASLPAEHRGGDNFGPLLGGGPGPIGSQSGNIGGNSDPWPLAQPDMPSIKNLQVQCEKSFMRVAVEFDRPFYGVIFSKGYYSDSSCVHVQPGTGSLSAQFDIYLNSCGMTSSSNVANVGQPTPSGTFIENIVIIQYDPLVQEVWDAARKLRCTWFDYYEKSITFRPFQVDMLNAVTANFLGDNLQCWMQVQVGKGPWASEVSGIVKIGQTMTMVLAIKDDENKFDMMVRNCVAHDGKRAPIQLVDERGCVTRPKIMGKFQKVKNFGSSASVVSYAYFQAFKFPDSMNVHFQCVIQVCRYNCPEAECDGPPGIQGQQGQVGQAPSIGYEAVGSEARPSYQKLPQDLDPRTSAKISGNKGKNLIGLPAEPNVDRSDPPAAIPAPYAVPVAPHKLVAPAPRGYPNINRVGVAPGDSAGRPRSLDFNNIDDEESKDDIDRSGRSRRFVVSHVYKREAQEMTDVSTSRVIQVVAPGDVAFNLNAANETVVVSELVDEGSNVCMTTAGFAVGIIILLCVMVIACIVACFLYSRVRTFNNKQSMKSFVSGYEGPEFVKVQAPQ